MRRSRPYWFGTETLRYAQLRHRFWFIHDMIRQCCASRIMSCGLTSTWQLTLLWHLTDTAAAGSTRERILEKPVETRLAQNGWRGRSAAIVIDPELEVWFWSDSPHVETALGWVEGRVRLEKWLVEQGYLVQGQQKPHRPKDAVLNAWRLSKTQRSSSNYGDLAKKVDFQHCTDPAFLKLRTVLKQWFPPEG